MLAFVDHERLWKDEKPGKKHKTTDKIDAYLENPVILFWFWENADVFCQNVKSPRGWPEYSNSQHHPPTYMYWAVFKVPGFEVLREILTDCVNQSALRWLWNPLNALFFPQIVSAGLESMLSFFHGQLHLIFFFKHTQALSTKNSFFFFLHFIHPTLKFFPLRLTLIYGEYAII